MRSLGKLGKTLSNCGRIKDSVSFLRIESGTYRWFSSSHLGDFKLRIAVVGGGVGGLSTALHLAPLVDSNIVQGPIDIYESSNLISAASAHNSSHTNEHDEGHRSKHDIDSSVGREVGVGIWSTALTEFCKYQGSRPSHDHTMNELESNGVWLSDVGYRTPDGSWLARSKLAPFSSDRDDAALIFVKEKILLQTLREAVNMEKGDRSGNSTADDNSGIVDNIQMLVGKEVKAVKQVFSLRDRLNLTTTEKCAAGSLGRLVFADGTESKSAYHLIIDACGTYSNLRKRYSAHLPINANLAEIERDIEDRNYLVFRGNSPLNIDVSFQTWGEGKCMRFATVPVPLSDGKVGNVWFATTSDSRLMKRDMTSEERKKILLDMFADWHEPVTDIIESTPQSDILMDPAKAHKFCASALGEIIDEEEKNDVSLDDKNVPPLLCFIGDADMTVDPVLAQGFTIAMEDAAHVAGCVSRSFPTTTLPGNVNPLLRLRQELIARHENKKTRLQSLLRATMVVQTLAQPPCTNMFGKLFKVEAPRFFAKYIMPGFMKDVIFHWIMRYSLGLIGTNLGGKKLK